MLQCGPHESVSPWMNFTSQWFQSRPAVCGAGRRPRLLPEK
jgi:hypothetical protein